MEKEEEHANTSISEDNGQKDTTSFKKPILIGKRGKFPRRIVEKKEVTENEPTAESSANEAPKPDDFVQVEDVDKEQSKKPALAPAQKLGELSMPLPYKEPKWSGLPHSEGLAYKFEVLKNGSIIEEINLMSRPFFVFGRLPNCDVYMQHPTISRYHAVVQYREEATEEEPRGFYLYDLNSTHGTFLNKNKLKPRHYVRIRVGHIVKLGGSSRNYVLMGPQDDSEEESELSVTELKIQRKEELLEREEAAKLARLKKELEEKEARKKEEEKGVDWGLGEDAEEEADLTENPFAQTNNEELYLDDPKKALRGFMEREGYDFEYDCTEQGFGQFLCKVELPVDDENGRPLVAEVLHKGKKKEAVVQCALEACRILDRHGLLRQATHESRKRKAKNWEENDYYDSDDDTFLDRTGSIEKKREKRMMAKQPEQPETYQSLLEKEKNISNSIAKLERTLSEMERGLREEGENTEEDSLDRFMKVLNKFDKNTVRKTKADIASLKVQHANVIKLLNIARPADLPPLVAHSSTDDDHVNKPGTSESSRSKVLPVFGKRSKVKVQMPVKSNVEKVVDADEDEAEDDETVETLSSNEELAGGSSKDESLKTIEDYCSLLESYTSDFEYILNELGQLSSEGDKISIETRTIIAKGRKLQKHIQDLDEDYTPRRVLIVCKEWQRIYSDMEDMTLQKCALSKKIKLSRTKLELLCKTVENVHIPEDLDSNEAKKKKNQRRIQQRQEKAKIEQQKGYVEDARKEDYNMWVPPKDQTGDGRTSLNEKFGY